MPRSILAIDWDNHELRLVEAGFRGQAIHAQRIAVEPLKKGLLEQDGQAAADYLREALRRHRIGTRVAVAAVPREQAILKLLTVPNAPPDEMPGIVQFQAIKEMSFPAEEAVIDYSLMTGSANGKRQVLVAAVTRKVLQRYRTLFAGAGLKLVRLGLRPHANLIALLHSGQAPETGAFVMVDLSPSMVEINIAQERSLLFSRSVSLAYPDENENAAHAMRMLVAREYVRSIQAYRAQAVGPDPARLLLLGSAVNDASVEQFKVISKLRTQRVDPLESVSRPKEFAGPTTPFAVCLGLATGELEDRQRRYDFLNPKKTTERGRRRRLGVLATAACLLVAASVGYYHAQDRLAYTQQHYEVAREMEQTRKEEAKRVEQLGDDVVDVKAWQDAESLWLEEVKSLTEYFPSTKVAYVRSVLMNGARNINLNGRAIETAVVDEFRARLYRTGEYRPNPKAIRKAPGDEIYPYTFELAIEGGKAPAPDDTPKRTSRRRRK